MKKNILLLLCLCFFAGCDIIAPDDRIIPVEDLPPQKTVLLEDFTGWRCTNCPDAATVARELQTFYGHRVVVVSLHPEGSYWTEPVGKALDLRSEAATAYYNFFGKPEAFPTGLVDRVAFAGKHLLDYNTWIRYTKERIVQKQPLEISLTCAADTSTRQLTIEAEITATDVWNKGDVSYLLWLTESHIIGAQYVGGTARLDYEHNHVLRDAINGIWGESVVAPAIGDKLNKNNTYAVPPKFVIGNCQVVGILYLTETKEIINAFETSIEESN
ncbi:MAG: Omp28 family outer membrane lipoprotein [Prevotellaceae bacterium]|jgi:hypothetical protein|nr:Omp28 family outer membrane lipoprotein [Prevotellaceae bacterium]